MAGAASTGGRFKQLFKKYGKVALGVHFTVSAASIGGLYIAIKSNVDVESLLAKVGMGGGVGGGAGGNQDNTTITPTTANSNMPPPTPTSQVRNRTAELAASSGGALALAFLCNKALFPIRVPITLALTPPVARFLRARNIIRNL